MSSRGSGGSADTSAAGADDFDDGVTARDALAALGPTHRRPKRPPVGRRYRLPSFGQRARRPPTSPPKPRQLPAAPDDRGELSEPPADDTDE